MPQQQNTFETPPEQLPDPDYSELEDLLFKGFLVRPSRIGRVPVVFKSINQKERQSIYEKTSVYEEEDKQTLEFGLHLIAYSVYRFNHQNVLPSRSDFVPRFVETFRDLPSALIEDLLRFLSALNERAGQKVEFVEPYTYGDFSRYKWRSLNGMPPNDPRSTGIEGTDQLGLNQHQELWVALNRQLDDEEEFLRQRQNAAYTASAFAPEGIEKVQRKEKNKRDQEEREQKLLYKTKGKQSLPKEGQIKIQVETPEELDEQFQRDQSDEMDWHDWVIHQQEQEMKEEFQKEQQAYEAASSEESGVKKKQVAAAKESGESIVAYDPEEAEKIAEKQRERREAHRVQGDFESASDRKQKERRLKKWDILEDDPDEYQQPDIGADQPVEETKDHSLENTVLEDHYQKKNQDLKDYRDDEDE